jgi:hypothetical protein
VGEAGVEERVAAPVEVWVEWAKRLEGMREIATAAVTRVQLLGRAGAGCWGGSAAPAADHKGEWLLLFAGCLQHVGSPMVHKRIQTSFVQRTLGSALPRRWPAPLNAELFEPVAASNFFSSFLKLSLSFFIVQNRKII